MESQQTSHLKSRLHLTLPKLWPSVVFFKCSESNTHSPNVPPLKCTGLNLDRRTHVRFVVYHAYYARTRKGFSFESILVLHKFKLKMPRILTLYLSFLPWEIDSELNTQCLAPCLMHSRASVSTCWRDEEVDERLFLNLFILSAFPCRDQNTSTTPLSSPFCFWSLD